MKLHVIFGLRHCRYEGQYAPEVIDCWDDLAVEGFPQGFDEAVANAMARVGALRDFASVRVINIKVDGEKITEIFKSVTEVPGEVEE